MNNNKKRKQSPVQLTLEGAKLPKLSPLLVDSQGNEWFVILDDHSTGKWYPSLLTSDSQGRATIKGDKVATSQIKWRCRHCKHTFAASSGTGNIRG